MADKMATSRANYHSPDTITSLAAARRLSKNYLRIVPIVLECTRNYHADNVNIDGAVRTRYLSVFSFNFRVRRDEPLTKGEMTRPLEC